MRVEKLGLQPATLAGLHNAGIINMEQLKRYTCSELMEHPDIGPARVYEIIRQLNKRGLMLPANQYGRVRRPSERNLEMFRLRFIEGLGLVEIGRRTGVSRARVHQLLHFHFGITKLPLSHKIREVAAQIEHKPTSCTPTNAQLGQTISQLRQARQLSQDQLAVDAHMHPTSLSKIERGLQSPTWESLSALAHALDIEASTLIRLAEDEARTATPEA
jgi:DNA-binding transcriptional regulator YiaG